MRKITLMIFMLFSIFVIPVSVTASDYDGSKPLIAAVTETYECTPGKDCLRGTAESINIPQFLKINFKDNVIHGEDSDGIEQRSDIKNIIEMDDTLILQAVQNSRGWSMVINKTTGKFTITASGDLAGYVIFGACLSK